MNSHVLYASHLLRTKHQADYHKFILNSLEPGDAVVIIEYKMKLELGVRLHECQQDRHGKRGISLHGLLVIAQVDANAKGQQGFRFVERGHKAGFLVQPEHNGCGIQMAGKNLPWLLSIFVFR